MSNTYTNTNHKATLPFEISCLYLDAHINQVLISNSCYFIYQLERLKAQDIKFKFNIDFSIAQEISRSVKNFKKIECQASQTNSHCITDIIVKLRLSHTAKNHLIYYVNDYSYSQMEDIFGVSYRHIQSQFSEIRQQYQANTSLHLIQILFQQHLMQSLTSNKIKEIS